MESYLEDFEKIKRLMLGFSAFQTLVAGFKLNLFQKLADHPGSKRRQAWHGRLLGLESCRCNVHECLGLELAAHGIRCNVVSPGSTDTPMQRSLWGNRGGAREVIAGSQDAFRTGIPLGKLAAAQDIADAVLFLVSDRAGHITMQDLCVDGGATLRA